jgi:hypothetical protein
MNSLLWLGLSALLLSAVVVFAGRGTMLAGRLLLAVRVLVPFRFPGGLVIHSRDSLMQTSRLIQGLGGLEVRFFGALSCLFSAANRDLHVLLGHGVPAFEFIAPRS